MGNVLNHAAAKEVDDSDLEWLTINNNSAFDDDYVTENFEKLPEFEGTEVVAEEEKKKNVTDESGSMKRLTQLISDQKGSVTHVGDFGTLAATDELSKSSFATMTKMRSRLLQRIHLALLRERQRVRNASDSQTEAFFSKAAVSTFDDVNALLTASSVRMSLTIMKALRASHPEIFTEVANGLMEMLLRTKSLALSSIRDGSPHAETLQAIVEFASHVANSSNGEERSQSLALVLAVALSKGSVKDLLVLVNMLIRGKERLPTGARAIFSRLEEQKNECELGLTDPVAVTGSFPCKYEVEVSGDKIAQMRANIATDGVYLFVWDGFSKSLAKIGTGFHGTIAGNEYGRNVALEAQLRAKVGDDVYEDEPAATTAASTTTPASGATSSTGLHVIEEERKSEPEVEVGLGEPIFGVESDDMPTQRSSEASMPMELPIDEPEHSSSRHASRSPSRSPAQSPLLVNDDVVVVSASNSPVSIGTGADDEADEASVSSHASGASVGMSDLDETITAFRGTFNQTVPIFRHFPPSEDSDDIVRETNEGEEISFDQITFREVEGQRVIVGRCSEGLIPLNSQQIMDDEDGTEVEPARLWIVIVRSSIRRGPGDAAPVREETKSDGSFTQAWIACAGGKLYLRMKNIIGPARVAVLSTASLKVDSIIDVCLPIDGWKQACGSDDSKGGEDESKTESKAAGGEEWHRGEETNFASYDDGTRVVSASTNFNSTGGVMERNILVDTASRVAWVDDTEFRYLFQAGDTSQNMVVDLGQMRLVSRIGADFTTDGEHAVTDHFCVEISTDGREYHTWGEVSSSPSSPMIFDRSASYHGPDEVRFIRFSFGSNAAGGGVIRLFIHGFPKTKGKSKLPFPFMASDGRYLIFVHAGFKNNVDTKENEPELQAIVVDPLNDMSLVSKVSFPWGVSSEGILHECAVSTNGSRINLQSFSAARGKDDKTVNATCRQLNLVSSKVVSEKTFAYDPKVCAPHACVYDLRNNVTWGWDPVCSRLCRWRNFGLQPKFAPPRPSTSVGLMRSASPIHRLDALLSVPENMREAEMEAAIIMCHIDRLCELYAPPVESLADSKASDEIEITSAGFEDGNFCRFLIRGQVVGTSQRGFNVVQLNDAFEVVDSRSFDTFESTAAADRLADFLDGLKDGETVLIAVCDEGSTNLNTRAKLSLRTVGADRIDYLHHRDAFAMIGRKGGSAATVTQKIVLKGKGVAIARQRLPTPLVPLRVDVSRQTLEALVDMITANKDALFGDVSKLTPPQYAILLSALRVMTANTFQLLRGTPISQAIEIFPESPRKRLLEVLLAVIDKPSADEAARPLIEASLQLFITAIDILYPTPSERCQLLVQYLNEFMENTLSECERSVLDLLLRQMSNPTTLSNLLQGSGSGKGASPTELIRSLLLIAEQGTIGKMQDVFSPGAASASIGSVGGGAVQMLAPLCNQVLSQSCQSIVTSKDAVDGELADPSQLLNLTGMVSELAKSSAKLLRHAVSLNDKSGQAVLETEIENILKDSHVGALLPLAVSTMSILVKHHGAKMVKLLTHVTAPLAEIVSGLEPTLRRLSPASMRVTAGKDLGPKKATLTFESLHPYTSNTDQMIEVSVPGAISLSVTFNEETKTEQNYDYVILWHGPEKGTNWHPGIEKYTGRNGTENFPGQAGRPPLIIPADHFTIEWHSDGSNEDWGWRMNVVGEFKRKPSSAKEHWMVGLEKQIADCGGNIVNQLIRGLEWNPMIEEATSVWMEDTLIGKSASGTAPSDNPEEALLLSLIDRPAGSISVALVTSMKKQVSEDQGKVELINRAVYATCAALIKHNGLMTEALAIAKGQREGGASESMVKSWRAGQKMRQYFDYGDLLNASKSASVPSSQGNDDDDLPSAPSLGRAPSIYQGADNSVVERFSNKVVQRAKFLLSLPAPEKKIEVAKKRWGLIAKLTRSTSKSEEKKRWANLVDEVQSSLKLKDMLNFRRKMAEKKTQTQEVTPSERVLRFLQSQASTEDIDHAKNRRSARASLRAEGIRLANDILGRSVVVGSKMWISTMVTEALRQTKIEGKSGSHVHYLSGVEGCGLSNRDELVREYCNLLSSLVRASLASFELFNATEKKYAEAVPGSAEAKTHENDVFVQRSAVVQCLKAAMIDYDLCDHTLLESSGLLICLEGFVRSTDITIRSAAFNCLELLVARCVGLDGQVNCPEEPTEFSKQLIALVIRELERASRSVEGSTPRGAADFKTALPTSSHVDLLKGAIHLKNDVIGYVVPHVHIGMRYSFSMWLRRDRNNLDDRAENSIREGDRVVRGPDFAKFCMDDGGDGKLGTVSRVDGTSVTVRWDGLSEKTYKFGEVEGTTKKYEVLPVAEGTGGCLFSKGAPSLLTEEETEAVWSSFGIDMRADSRLRFWATSGKDQRFKLDSKSRLPHGQWVHVVFTQDKARCKMVINGVVDCEGMLDGHMLNPGKGSADSRMVESPHPYNDNMDQYWPVEVDNALSFSVTFDPQSKTEANYDYVRFYKNDSHSDYWGEEKYTGGRGGSSMNFPGTEGRAALQIAANRFVIFFHSDGSNNDWGFRVFVQAAVPERTDDSSESSIQELNGMPIYIGQPATHASSANACNIDLYGLTLANEPLQVAQCKTLYDVCSPSAEVRSGDEPFCLDVLAMLYRAGKTMESGSAGSKAFTGPHVIEPLLNMAFRGPFAVRIASLSLCRVLLPETAVDVVEAHATRLGLLENGTSFLDMVLVSIGKAHNPYFSIVGGEVTGSNGTDNMFSLAHHEVLLLRKLASSDLWANYLLDTVKNSCGVVSTAISALTSATAGEIASRKSLTKLSVSNELYHRVMGVFVLIGGGADGLFPGASALLRSGSSDQTVMEECVVVSPAYPPVLPSNAPKEEKEGWKEFTNFGDALAVVLRSQPSEVIRVKRNQLVAKPASLTKAMSNMLAKDPGFLRGLFNDFVDLDTVDKRDTYASIINESEKSETLESAHPYPDSLDDYHPVTFPGATTVEISFTSTSRTETNCDYVRFYKNDNHSDYWGAEKYHGRDGGQNWPGCEGRGVLIIPAETFVVYFHSDGSQNDWGYRMTMKAKCVDRRDPPHMHPLRSIGMLGSLKLAALKALHQVITECDWITPSLLSITRPLAADALRALPEGAGGSVPPTPLVLESAHPYNHSDERYENVKVPGAKKLILSFDSQTRSENGCDYMRIYKDESKADFWGENQYTGGKDGGNCNWPSIKGRPPLIIPSDHFTLYWHTDGSVNDWGWKMTILPELGTSDASSTPLLLVSSRLYHYSQLMREQPQMPEYSTNFAGFTPRSYKEVSLFPALDDPNYLHLDNIDELEAKGHSAAAKQSKKSFVLNSSETTSIDVRRAAEDSSASEMTITADSCTSNNTRLVPQGESGDWLRVKVESKDTGLNNRYGWVRRRLGDAMYLIAADVASDEGLITLDDCKDENYSFSTSSTSPGASRNAMFDVDESKAGGIYSVSGAAKPSEVLRGCSTLLESALVTATNVGIVRYSQECLASLISSWPQNIPFDLNAFGNVNRFLSFLRLAHGSRKTDANSANTLMILRDKILNVVRRQDSGSDALSSSLVLFALKQLTLSIQMVSGPSIVKAVLKSFETKHPYDDNTDQYWPISFPGAKYLRVEFDKRSATEMNCDYVYFYTDSSHSTRLGGQYTGRVDGSDKNYPGVNRPPLVLDTDTCEMYFHSDGSNTDWGVKVNVYGVMECPSEDARAVEKKAKSSPDSPDTELAYWILELLSKEDNAVISTHLYSTNTIRVLRKFLEITPADKTAWVINMITTMLQEIRRWNLSAEASKEVKKLGATIRQMTNKQYANEQALDVANRSPLLQSLVQASVVVETTVSSFLSTFASTSSSEGSVALESKEEHAQEHSPAVLSFSPEPIGPNIETLNSRTGVRKAPKAAAVYTSALALMGYDAGVHTVDMEIRAMTAEGPRIGMAKSSIDLSVPLGSSADSIGWGTRRVYAFGRQAEFGPKFSQGDVISVVIDMGKKTLSFWRNKAFVGIAVGPVGSGAAIELDIGEGPFHPAVAIQTPIDEVRLAMHEDDDDSKAGDKDEDVPEWLSSVRESVELMRALSRRELPFSMIQRVFIPQCQKTASVVVETSHPYNGSDISRVVTIAGADRLEVRFDPQTRMGPNDTVEVGQSSAGIHHELIGLEGGTETASADSAQIQVGDRVVRGSSWDYGDQDGGAGGFGTVEAIGAWKTKAGSGVTIRWRDSEFTGMYRWNYEGSYDMKVVGRDKKSAKPIKIPGDTVTIDVIPGPAVLARQNSVGMDWVGCLKLHGQDNSHICILHDSELEMMGDFTIEAWIKLEEVGSGPFIPIAFRGCQLDDIPLVQFSLQLGFPDVCDKTTLCLAMSNASTSSGIQVFGGTVNVSTWTHVAASIQGTTARLFVNAIEVATGTFSGDRMAAMDSMITLGKEPTGLLFKGNMYDFRIYRIARSAAVIEQDRTKLPRRGEETLICHIPLQEVREGDVHTSVRDHATSGGQARQVSVMSASWDTAVEPPMMPPGSTWGLKCTVIPIFSPTTICALPQFKAEYDSMRSRYTVGELKHDNALVRYINEVSVGKSMDAARLLRCAWSDMAPSRDDLVRLPILRELVEMACGNAETKEDTPSAAGADATQSMVEARFRMLQVLNGALQKTIPLVDLCMLDKAWSIAFMLANSRGLIFRSIKEPIYTAALAATAGTGGSMELRLARGRAGKMANEGKVDEDGHWSIFGQAFRQLHTLAPASLRRADRLYTVNFLGERAIDAGGPYRESWSMYCLELQSAALPLLLRTPNGRHSMGQNRDKWVLNPGSTTPTQLEMFSFLGKIMGVSIRSKECIALNISSIIWKLLVNDTPTRDDLEGIDQMIIQSLDSIRNIDQKGVDEDSFDSVVMENFTTISTDDRTVELMIGGAASSVSFGNRGDYCDKVEHYRLHEFDQVAAAVRRGLASIIPQKLLSLFAWDELEIMVCGRPEIDVGLLRSCTEYSGYSSTDQTVTWFWQVLTDFTNEERSMMLRFTWGRSRLPINVEAFTQRFKLQQMSSSPANNYLPVSHTCFFSLELPNYSSIEIMREKLRYAIYNCQAIDGDNTSIGMAANAMEWDV